MVDVLGFTINIGLQELLILLAGLALFLIISRKIVSTIFNLIWISAASALFPFAMRFIGLDFSTDMNSVIFFITLGIGLYAIYNLGRIVYVLLGLAENAAKAVAYPLKGIRKRKEDKMKKKVEKLLKEKEKKEE